MKPTQIVKAYKAVQELSTIVLPYRASRGVSALSKKLTEEFDIVATLEKNLLDEFGGEPDQNGNVKFPTAEAANEFAEKYKSAMDQDDEITLPKVDLSKYVDLIRISAEAMDALDGIVTFENDQ